MESGDQLLINKGSASRWSLVSERFTWGPRLQSWIPARRSPQGRLSRRDSPGCRKITRKWPPTPTRQAGWDGVTGLWMAPNGISVTVRWRLRSNAGDIAVERPRDIAVRWRMSANQLKPDLCRSFRKIRCSGCRPVERRHCKSSHYKLRGLQKKERNQGIWSLSSAGVSPTWPHSHLVSGLQAYRQCYHTLKYSISSQRLS